MSRATVYTGTGGWRLNSSLDGPRARLRRSARAARLALPASERQRLAAKVASFALRRRSVRAGQRIALYWPQGSELDTRPLLTALLTKGCAVYLPRIVNSRAGRMEFVAYDGGPLRRNAFGILEPRRGRRVAAQYLDVIFMPLAAFDAQGNRLGSGAGFYDRALNFRHRRHRWFGPRLIGLAFACQELPQIGAARHDVALDGIITELGYREFRR